MTELNKFVRTYRFEKHALIYNTINGEIIILPQNGLINLAISDNISNLVKEYMYKHYFLDRDLPWHSFEDRFESNNRLLISLETFLACNLSCPYCYQINNNHDKAKISRYNLDLLFDYITSVHQKSRFDILILKILGGEPSLDWTPADYLLQKIVPFCKTNHIKLGLRIDTNCTDTSDFTSLSGYDTILFTVPLCHKESHDRYRHYRNGRGTYDEITENALVLSKLPNSQLVLRHNTDSYNINRFDEYLEDVSAKGLTIATIMPQFTTNPDYGDYKNQLTYQQYVNWLSSDCIDSMIKHGFYVPIYPRLLLDGKCQQWSKYSFKLFSDGKVGACAAHFFDPQNPRLTDIMDEGTDSITKYWNSTKSFRVFDDSMCRNCASLFGCSGHYKLPCIQELGLEPCKPEENLYLNWELYFQTIYKHICQGKSTYFPNLKISHFYGL